MLSRFFLLIVLLAPLLAFPSEALFVEDSLVRMLEPDAFKHALEPNETSMVAFLSPSRSNYEQLIPEYEKAALGLYPFIPTYAIDCDENHSRRLCEEQAIERFPTIKLFPRGNMEPSLIYEDANESASAFYYWATRRIPSYVTKHHFVEDIAPWVAENIDKHAVLLLSKEKKVPIMWKILANKYVGQLDIAYHRDRKGKSSVKLGMEAGGTKEAKVLVYPAGSTAPLRYEGVIKMDSLSRFFELLISGTMELSTANREAMEEKFVPDEKELEIERKQEAQRLALAHGGFTSLIDFEKAIKEGHGADYHDIHGFPGMKGELPVKNKIILPESDPVVGGRESFRVLDEL